MKAAASRSGKIQRNARSILIADNVLTGLEFASTLTDAGYEVIGIAEKPAEVVSATGELRPDLILMGTGLREPGDGISAAFEIAQRFGTPLIFVHARGARRVLARVAAARPVGHLHKPCSRAELLKTVDHTFSVLAAA